MIKPFEGLLGNNCELRILEYLLPLKDLEFNIAELAEEVGVSRITATRIVKKFTEWGVLKSPRTMDNAIYYTINHESSVVKSVEQFNNALIENILGDDTLYEIHDYWEAQRPQIPSDLVCTALIDFQNINWESLVAGVRHKTFIRGNKRLRLVEFSDTFIEYDWCTKSHIGYIVDGNISIDFNGELVKFKSGDGLFISGGEESRHNASISKGEKALLILLEDT